MVLRPLRSVEPNPNAKGDDEESLIIKLGAMDELAALGQSTIAADWLIEWVNITFPGKQANWDVFGAPFHLISHAVELLKAVTATLRAGLSSKGLGLVGPSYTLLRGQLECKWSIALLVQNPSLFQQNCMAFVYCYNMIRYKSNVITIETQPEGAISSDQEKKLKDEQEAQKLALLGGDHYSSAERAYKTSGSNPDWFELFPILGKKKISGMRGLATAVGEERVWKSVYSYWSAIAHGFAPPIGEQSGNSVNGWIELQPSLADMNEIADSSIDIASDTFRSFVNGIMPNASSVLEKRLKEITSNLPYLENSWIV